MRSGDIKPGNSTGTLRYAGINGAWWSSRMADTIWSSAGVGAYELVFLATESHPSRGPDARYQGYSLRCLSTVLDI